MGAASVAFLSELMATGYRDDLLKLLASPFPFPITDCPVVVYNLPGYVKYKHADGSTFIYKRHQTYIPSYGSGNKARRRQGFTAQYIGDGEFRWIKRKKRPPSPKTGVGV